MKYLSVAAILVASAAAAQSGVDISEILRRGDMVEVIDGHRQQDPVTGEITEAMKIPADDSGKWFVSVITTDGCKYCEMLKKDWKTSPSLKAIADSSDPQNSWAHLNFYRIEDKSQTWRWKDRTFRGYPTVLVQPPRNGEYGPPSEVVYAHAGYDGDDDVQARKILSAIKLRISKYAIKRHARGPPETTANDSPWDDSPEPARTPLRPRRVPEIPPIESPGPFPTWTIPTLFAGGPLMWLALGGIAWWGFEQVREWRKKQGKKLVVNDQMMELLEQFARKFDLERDDETTPNKEPKK